MSITAISTKNFMFTNIEIYDNNTINHLIKDYRLEFDYKL